MNQPSTTAGTFEPDWDAIRKASNDPFYGVPFSSDAQYHAHICQAMAAEWNRQAASAGLVLVRRDDLIEFMAYAANPKRLHTAQSIAAWERIIATLNNPAATPQPTPGGDAG